MNESLKVANQLPLRRWSRFGLRTAFGVLTIVAILLAFWIAPALRQRWVVEKIQRLGGTVDFDAPLRHQDPSGPGREPSPPDWLRAIIGEDMRSVTLQRQDLTGSGALDFVAKLHGLECLSLSHSKFEEEKLAQLKDCPSLRDLFLGHTQVGDKGIAFLRHASELEKLNLAYTRVTDEGVKHIAACSKLNYLCLGGTNVGDASVPVLSNLTNLRELEIFKTKFTDDGIKELQSALPNCKIVR